MESGEVRKVVRPTGKADREEARGAGGLLEWANRFAEDFVPVRCRDNAELTRRARLVIKFSFLGLISGALYAAFFLFVEHFFGAAIIVVCSLGFILVPFTLKRTGALDFCGNVLAGIMTVGFTALCGVEGGMHGHALAWLASVPLCALLLVGKHAAKIWVIVSFMASAGMIALGLLGVALPKTYPPEWDGLISALGYLGLIPFMFLLGMSFETGRETAFGKMQEALKELEASNKELHRLNEEKTEFMSIAAHDLKNPLTIIIGNAELIRSARNPGKLPQLVENILVSGTRMYDLIKNLLDNNAIEEGRYRLKTERCDLGALVVRCLEANYFNATRKDIELQLTKADEVWIKVDEEATLQVLDNLVSNAVKYSQLNTMVKVQVAVEAGQATVSVRDDGPGLSVEDQKMLFRKFTRLTAKPTNGESSNGLGLSIVKRLAEGMGGSIECQSVLGQGATFRLKLPLWDKEPSQKREAVLEVAE